MKVTEYNIMIPLDTNNQYHDYGIEEIQIGAKVPATPSFKNNFPVNFARL